MITNSSRYARRARASYSRGDTFTPERGCFYSVGFGGKDGTFFTSSPLPCLMTVIRHQGTIIHLTAGSEKHAGSTGPWFSVRGVMAVFFFSSLSLTVERAKPCFLKEFKWNFRPEPSSRNSPKWWRQRKREHFILSFRKHGFLPWLRIREFLWRMMKWVWR